MMRTNLEASDRSQFSTGHECLTRGCSRTMMNLGWCYNGISPGTSYHVSWQGSADSSERCDMASAQRTSAFGAS